MKRKIVLATVFAMVLAIGLAACGSSSGSKSAGSNASSASAETSYADMQIGKTATLDNGLEITVNEVEVFTPQYSDKAATRVNVTYVNNSNEKQSFNLFDWKAEDADGAERLTTIVMGSENELGSGDLKAGGKTSGNIYFDGDDNVKVYYYSNMLLQKDSDVSWKLQ